MPANEKFWHNLGRLHVIFAVSSAALFVAILWMMAGDHAAAWRDHQRTTEEILAAKLSSEYRQFQTDGALSERILAAEKELQEAEDDLEKRGQDLTEAQQKVQQLSLTVDLADREVRARRAYVGEASANYDLGVRDQVDARQLKKLLGKVEEERNRVAKLVLDQQQKATALAEAKQQLTEITKARDAAQAELERLRTDMKLKHAALTQIAPESTFSAIKRNVMEWPIIDGFNSPLEVKHDWIPTLEIQLGMSSAARFDNCRTCHMLIDRVQAGNVPEFPHGEPTGETPAEWVRENEYPHPYATHPRPDLFVTATSPHPAPAGGGPGTFGCTICHDGQGSATSFDNAEHTAADPYEAEEWNERHGHHPNHHWEYPMLPGRLLEATCIKCHHQVEELAVHPKFGTSAPQVAKGYHLIQEYGCFGCHEIQGFAGDKAIGPDLRLEPNYAAAAEQLLRDPYFISRKTESDAVDDGADDGADDGVASSVEPAPPHETLSLDEIREMTASLMTGTQKENPAREALQAAVRQEAGPLAHTVATKPFDSTSERERLYALLDGDHTLARSDAAVLSPGSHALLGVLQPYDHPGALRKVGPSLRHIASKSSQDWLEYWVEEPKRFRPDTKMPQFFKLSNQHDEMAERLMPIELAGIAQYLTDKSQPLDSIPLAKADYEPDAERGAKLFAQRGCLACHTHEKVPGTEADFGPNLSKVHEKIKAGHAPGEPGFQWLYTWVRDPQRHHPRTKMPNLYLEPYTQAAETEGEDENYIDPAADIAAFLLQGGSKDFPAHAVKTEALDELVRLYLSKSLTEAKVDQTFEQRRYPLPPDQIKGDEIELARGAGDEPVDDATWRRMKLEYIGRRTISRYGCYGCHDVPGFEAARPIGTTLQDWGRKDTTRLAFEHIEEYLHHHGEPDGGSTYDRVAEALRRAPADDFASDEVREREMSAAYFYENLLHHGRNGFLWQKLRAPRSYDYEKTETRGYDERLRMPKFPFEEKEIEAIATFVLGLVADPPSAQYIYKPEGPAADRIAGEKLLRQYNCTGCHMVELPLVKYGVDPSMLPPGGLSDAEHPAGLDLLLQLKPPRDARTGETLPNSEDGIGEEVIGFHGLQVSSPDPLEDPEFQEYGFDLWETIQVGEKRVLPGARMLVQKSKLKEIVPARGGDFAEWLVERLKETRTDGNSALAWQMSPPPLYKEGIKVQNEWLYRFLRDPERLRFTTVLRMPRFNLSPDEARTLANYFAAADEAPYPYPAIPQRDPEYLARMQDMLGDLLANDSAPGGNGDGIVSREGGEAYLDESWRMLNAPLCIKCHSVGGRQVQIQDPEKDIRGPNLQHVPDRLRPDWLLLWLYKPQWITPYTSMPAPLPRNSNQFENLFDGQSGPQTVGLRDALMNYHSLMETRGRYEETAPPVESEPPPAAEPEGNAPPEAARREADEVIENGNERPTASRSDADNVASPETAFAVPENALKE